MSAKLVVHKFESGINFKSLEITFDDGENGSNEARYGEWCDGETQQNNNAEKSSRLIVKIVTDNEYCGINLDSCAKEVESSQITYNDNTAEQTPYDCKQNLLCYETNKADNSFSYASFSRPDNSQDNSSYKNNIGESRIDGDISLEDLSPLEYSLERVKENNARIMENIHLLNRTLNYTKNKEVLNIVHPKSMRFPCNTCGKCFVYETGLKRHCSMHHSVTEAHPRWQVVWTCIECFQVWPRQDLALKHSIQCCKNNNADSVREIKTSLLLQCEFCEKVYTSIPRLLRHSKVHTTAKNYECNVCCSQFPSYKAAEQHWLLCPWLQMCYNFSLPKMLLCNACDRKFKNYEQLYNHRYKVGHFMTKTHCNRSNIRSLGILVYQCELCSLWFPSIATLQNHRTQQHSMIDSVQVQQYNKIMKRLYESNKR